ncbi:Protein of unknown function [Devosia crocina]|uniref:DUF2934 domain-containing protein n=1 Tax=Devosia crocina TaxID=429728 RepID=A0A1I7N3B6_9HYPH|nr:DUF2934 domain-containing protein [Devosia crocina]SFV29093.1 Protein of unknown function [Devosia crocina]
MHRNPDLATRIRDTAYFLWEQDGRPEGRAMDYWLKAKQMLQRQMAYDRWLADGTPPDQSDLHWHEAGREIEEK